MSLARLYLSRILLCLTVSILWMGNAKIELGDSSGTYDAAFFQLLRKASLKLEYNAQRRPFRFKNLNQSLEETAYAVKVLTLDPDNRSIEEHLDAALKAFDGNAFAYLLYGILMDSRGNTPQANNYYEEFLMKSRSFTDFEKAFLSWSDYHRIRRHVYDLLEVRGVSFEGREYEIRTKIPWLSYLLNPDPEDQAMTLLFAIVLLGGGVLLFAFHLLGVEIDRNLFRSLIILYAGFWGAYGIWIYDLAIGLPYGYTRFEALPVVCSVTLGFVSLIWIRLFWKKWTRKPEAGFRICKKCGAEISSLLLECPECRTPL